MPNFALSHKAGPRRIERNLSFYCGGDSRAARTPVHTHTTAQSYCAHGAPGRIRVNHLVSAQGQVDNEQGFAMKGTGLLHPGKLAAVIVAGGLLSGAARAQSAELGAPSMGVL